MSLGVNLLMYLTEIASKSLGKDFLTKIYEVHHKFKKIILRYSINARQRCCRWQKEKFL